MDYQHNGSLPIGLYIVVEQPSGTGKSRSNSLFQDPFKKAQLEYSKEIKTKLDTLEKKKDKDRTEEEQCELNQLSKKPIPFFVTNSTPEALEETLNHTNGFFSAISSEQGLVNSVLIRLLHPPETYVYFQAGSDVSPRFQTAADGRCAVFFRDFGPQSGASRLVGVTTG
jgi:hypothetical protein